ncbi:hypothetical protein [Pseudomonas sp. BNK-15]|uniref:hypothetical protein n=1 Tax=Pseudomonas sp. BNK-15 TaxID=3376152 RepID=UPI0039BF30EA
MEQSTIQKAELMDALSMAIAFYQSGFPQEGEASFKKFVAKKLPDLKESICYKSLALFAQEEHVGTWSSMKWKETDKRWDKLNEYVENYYPFSGFFTLAAACVI